MFHFTPLLGAQDDSTASQGIIELDGGIKILVNVGWTEAFDPSQLKQLEKHAQSLSLILLTHATTSHLGAFAHCCKHFSAFTQIPVYATSPVISLGRTLLQDIYSSTPLASTIVDRKALNAASTSSSHEDAAGPPDFLLQPPTSTEIASYFALIHPLRYSQPHQPLPSPFSPPLNDLTITAFNAGHTLGGAIWHIQYGMESIVHAVDWNQGRENVCAGAAWLDNSGTGGAEVIEQLRKPTALICSTKGAERTALAGGRAKRDAILLDLVRITIEQGGSVLIPTDSSARALELAYVLEQAWRKDAGDSNGIRLLSSTQLCLASKTAGSTMRYARSMLEWMDDSIVRDFEAETSNSSSKQHRRGDSKQVQNLNDAQEHHSQATAPFEFRSLKLIESSKRLQKILAISTPKVILASDTSMEWGFSKEILKAFGTDMRNLVILADEHSDEQKMSSASCTIRSLLRRWHSESKSLSGHGYTSAGAPMELALVNGKRLEITDAQRAPLEGKEILSYQHYLATERQIQSLAQGNRSATLEGIADLPDDGSSSTSSSDAESDPEQQGKALNTTIKADRFNRAKVEPTKDSLGVNVLLRYKNCYDYDVRGKKGRDQFFPSQNRRRRGDEFGEIIKPEDYLRAEERDDVDGQDTRGLGLVQADNIGQKRKWQEITNQSEDGGSLSNGKHTKRKNGEISGENSRPHNPQGGASTSEDQGSSENSEGEVEDLVQGPAKLVTTTHTMDLNMKVAIIDFAGLHDQRSLSMLIPLIQPKKLLLIAGNASETAYLAKECQQKLASNGQQSEDEPSQYIFTPHVDETVDASVDTNAWMVKLSEALTRKLQWQNVRGLGVVTLAGHLAASTASLHRQDDDPNSARKKLKTLDDEKEAFVAEGGLGDAVSAEEGQNAKVQTPILDILPATVASTSRSMVQPIHVGDLRLADLRKLLQSTGHSADFRGEGTLLIDGTVAVRKSGTGQIEIESGSVNMPELRTRTSLEGPFYAVKRKIYEGLAVIAGG